MLATTLERPAIASTTKFVLERDVPIPPRKYGRSRSTIYPFSQMRVGDSFAVSLPEYGGGKTTNANAMQTGLGNLARNYCKTHDRNARFTTRKIADDTVRIWRVA